MHKKDILPSYIFLAAPFALYTIFVVVPIFVSIYLSLTQWSGFGSASFIGLRNFTELFKSRDFLTVMGNSGVVVLASVFAQSSVALFFAYLLSRTKVGYKTFRAIFFLPVVMAPMAVGLMFLVLYNSDVGPINTFFINIGLDGLARQWLSDPKIVLYSVIFPQLWQYLGFIMIIFLTGIQSIPRTIIESAIVDGANSISLFTRIVFPMIKNVVAVVVILNITGALKSFEYAYVLTVGGPGVKSAFLPILMFQRAFSESRMGSASSVAVVILVLALVSTIAINRIFSERNPMKG